MVRIEQVAARGLDSPQRLLEAPVGLWKTLGTGGNIAKQVPRRPADAGRGVGGVQQPPGDLGGRSRIAAALRDLGAIPLEVRKRVGRIERAGQLQGALVPFRGMVPLIGLDESQGHVPGETSLSAFAIARHREIVSLPVVSDRILRVATVIVRQAQFAERGHQIGPRADGLKPGNGLPQVLEGAVKVAENGVHRT